MSATTTSARDAYLAALLDADPPRAREIIEAAVQAGMEMQELYVDVFQDTLYELGRLWQTGHATVAQEHLATAVTQTLMAQLAGRARPSTLRAERVAITASTEDDLHGLGARFLADFLEAVGWKVIDLGPATPTDDLVRLAREVKPDVVCLSTTLRAHLPGARAAIDELRKLDPTLLLAVGGGAYRDDERLVAAVGADLHAPDAPTFLDKLNRRLGI